MRFWHCSIPEPPSLPSARASFCDSICRLIGLEVQGNSFMPSYYIVLEKDIPNFDVYVNGNMLAKESDALERLAKKSGVTPLLSFFSIDPEEVTSLVGDEGETIERLGGKATKEQWFNAEEG